MDDSESNIAVLPRHCDAGSLHDVHVVDFQIRDCSAQLGAPVDQPVGSENSSLVLQVYERVCDRLGPDFVHREEESRPVDADADIPELVADFAALLFLPLEDFFQEFLSS